MMRARLPFSVLLCAALMGGALFSVPARAASFDCGTAKAADEKAVCVNRDLSDLDVKTATLYEVLGHLVAMGQRGDLQEQQRAFLAYRATCGSRVACIRKAYDQRITQLNAGLQAIYARGPF
ncbi:hypothetical protein GCM10007301_51220 [Azorhizobium oxalatiphilum]|uniref:Lysozyme inhibitor LprI N-terminal domain-containing protein n=1 Tax=Azorhizobium oxalatiphilum TaxID=980631 RepID=A0A917FI88_9HYPH|nr:hypothetical protein [Azorhizobium oxalatiphilum]GGF85059.1 hypothetical protein GCM10007301_51220 [Azorhizobium oxalatiphilum]